MLAGNVTNPATSPHTAARCVPVKRRASPKMTRGTRVIMISKIANMSRKMLIALLQASYEFTIKIHVRCKI